ncbi:MAG TPA: hypothetical protein VFL55_15835, partial [Acetobacteraceae bacterium]|nr:hypothetical protein [Acetobacteraceae bacterium]
MPGLAKISLTLREALAPLLFSPPQAVFELYGYFDGVHGRYVEGWAFDAASPLSRLMLEVLDDAVVLGTTQARLFRADLEALGILDGSHAFRFELPDSIFDGKPHQISIRVANSHLSVPGGPRLLHTQSLVPYCKPTSSEAAGSCQTLASESAILLTLQCLADTLTAQTELLRVLLTERSKALPVVGCAESRTPQSLLSSPDTAAHLASALARRAGKHDYIVFSIIDWSFRTQRPQHLAAQLAARDNRVFYLSTRFLEMGSSGARFSIVAEPVEGVFEVALHCRSPHPVIYNGICDHAQLLDLIKALQSLVSMLRLQRIVGLLHLPSWYPL